jgi:hypothetical protein
MASLTLLAAEGVATLQRTPSKGNKKGKWGSWIEDSVSWMKTAGRHFNNMISMARYSHDTLVFKYISL